MNKVSQLTNDMVSPIFIVGSPRSGTTLTARVLGNHSKIFMPGETHFFDDIYFQCRELGSFSETKVKEIVINKLASIYARYNEPDDQARIERLLSKLDIINRLKNCDSYEALYHTFMDIQSEDCDKPRWGNQVPRDIFNIKEINTFFPNAKVILCVRDVRDFLLSYKNKWRATAKENIERLQKMYDPAITSFMWKMVIRKIPEAESMLTSDRLFILKYEELVHDPGQTFQAICDFISEKYEPEMLNIRFVNSSFESATTGIFNFSVGRWRKNLSAEESAISQIICGKEMTLLGYEKEKIKISYLKTIRLLVKTPKSFISMLSASRSMRGSLFAYIGRRLIPLLKTGK